ncbi:uncharacterized protein TA13355 [Theileria annulata]|uniref:JmjC domain-containing protein n=1 Tax=Theileria annulata TaxID=5874 RepID=Q4UEH4_THEAN|nr:uncharacterized protein TA13355 [Theileria annulata]CAI74515.1 hypothetical protein, conserved [Theileria annulata]|eukprot:XP_952247.1 hypothetical protein, conserved [Theileria annulata]
MREVPSIPRDSDFRDLIKDSIPFKISGYTSDDLGSCLEEWKPERLSSILSERRVSVHVSSEPNLNFVAKNFKYEYMTFSDLFWRIKESQKCLNGDREYLYYRSLGERPRKDPSNLSSVHPYLEETFKLPAEISRILDDSSSSIHSTVFRISQPGVELWTHYDALDNFLVQIHGSKLVILFPPSTLHKLSITDTSSPYRNICKLDMDSANSELLSAYKLAYKTVLNPGDVLFIPAAWSHGIHSLFPEDDSEEIKTCISVNLFFSDGQVEYASKNVYGNEDPAPMKRACDLLQKDFLNLSLQLPVHLQKAFWSKVASISLQYLNNL